LPIEKKEYKKEDFDREDRQGVIIEKEPKKVNYEIQITILNLLIEIFNILEKIEVNTRKI